MNKKKIINQVLITNDYSLFSKLKGNRNINHAHYKRLKESIKEESLLVPIIINEKYEIIDGQNRFEAWRELMLPIPYIVVKGYGLPQVQRLNSNIKNWSMKDYADCYSTLGNKHYKIYQTFKSKYELGDYESISLLQDQINGSGKNFDKFRNGKFKVKNYTVACENAEKILKLSTFYEGYKRRSFVFAMMHLINHNKFDFNLLLKKLKYQSTKLVDCTNKDQYLFLLQNIYNFKSSKKINLLYN